MKHLLIAAMAALSIGAATAAPASSSTIETAGYKGYVYPYPYPHIIYPWNPQPGEPCGPFNAYYPYCP